MRRFFRHLPCALAVLAVLSQVVATSFANPAHSVAPSVCHPSSQTASPEALAAEAAFYRLAGLPSQGGVADEEGHCPFCFLPGAALLPPPPRIALAAATPVQRPLSPVQSPKAEIPFRGPHSRAPPSSF